MAQLTKMLLNGTKTNKKGFVTQIKANVGWVWNIYSKEVEKGYVLPGEGRYQLNYYDI